MNPLSMGIDIGTTAIKIIVIEILPNDEVKVVLIESAPHDLLSPFPSWAEEDANVWKNNLFSLLKTISKKVDYTRLKGVALTGMVPALILLDKDGNIIRNSIQQNDMRTVKEIEELKSVLEKDTSYFEKVGSHVNSQHIAPRLLWLKRNEKENFEKIDIIFGSYDFAAYLLTGNKHIEANWALESGLFDFEGKIIDKVLEYIGFEKEKIPSVINSYEECGKVSKRASELTGLPEGLRIFAGTADHVASAFCTGALEDGDLVLKLGGAGDILLSLSEKTVDGRLFIDYFVSSACPYIINGCTAASGSLIKWFKSEFGGDFKELDKEAEKICAGSDGLVILPYVLGEKTPIMDPNARGVIFGLMLSHTKVHIYRAMLEAVAYAFRHHIDIFKEKGLKINNVYITNGGSTSPLWRQIMADVMGVEVNYIKTNPGSCLGAAFIAAISSKIATENIVKSFIKQKLPSYPNKENTRIYDNSYKIYRSLYTRLETLFPGNENKR